MKNLNDINFQIYNMRQELHNLINKKTSLLDEEIIEASQKLDHALDEYNNELIRLKMLEQKDKDENIFYLR